MKKVFLTIMTMGIIILNVNAQTAEELKAERQALKTELKSKDNLKMEKKFDKIAPKGGTMADIINFALSPMPPLIKDPVEAPLKNLVGDKEARIIARPNPTELNSVDGLVDVATGLLGTVVAINAVLSEYKNEIVESSDGEVDITKFKAKSDDYMAILPLLTQAGLNAAAASKKLKEVKSDISGLNPTTATNTIKTANWAIDAVEVTIYEIKTNTKLLQNLINSCKAAKNL